MARHRRAVRVFTALAVVLAAVLAGAGLLRSFGEDWARSVLLREMQQAIAPAKVSIAALEISLAPLAVELRGVVVLEEMVPRVRVARLRFLLRPLESLWEGAWIGDLELVDPAIRYDSRSIFAKTFAADREAPSTSSAAPVRIRQVVVEGGRADLGFTDAGIVVSLEDWTAEGRLGGDGGEVETSGRLRVQRSGAALDVTRLALRARFEQGRLRFEDLRITGAAGTMRGDVSLTGDVLDGHLLWEGTLEPIFALVPEAPFISGRGRIDAQLDGTTEHPEINANVVARGVRIDDVGFSGTGTLVSRGWDWTLAPAEVYIFEGRVEGTATGRWTRGIPYTVHGRFRDWSPSVFVALFGPQTPLRGAWGGEMDLSGHLVEDDLSGRGKFSLDAAGHALTGSAAFEVDTHRVHVEGRLEGADATEARCRYSVDHHQIGGEVEVRSDALQHIAAFAGLDVAGAGKLSASFSGTVADPVFSGDADAPSLIVSGASLGALRGPFSISRRGFETAGLTVAGLEASGRLGLYREAENDWTLRAMRSPVAPLLALARWFGASLPEVGGTVSGEAHGVGSWPGLDLTAHLDGNDLRFFDEQLGRWQADAAGGVRGWSLGFSARRDDAALLDVTASVAPDGALSGRVSGQGWRLGNMTAARRWLPAAEGAISISGHLAGTSRLPSGEAELQITALRVGDQPLGQARVTTRLAGDRLEIEGRVAERLDASGWVALDAPHAFQLRARAQDLELLPLPGEGRRLLVRLSGEGTLAGDAAQPLNGGRIELAEFHVRHGTEEISATQPILLEISRGEIRLPETSLQGAGEQLTLAGRIGPEGARAEMRGRGDLSLLEAFSTQVASARGDVRAEIELVRGVDQVWRGHGNARIEHGVVDLGFLVGITNLEGELAIEDRQAEIRGLSGQIGGGDFIVAGTLSLDRGLDVGWQVREANLGVPSWLDYRANGHGRLAGGWEAPHLDGEVEIGRAVYDRRIEWAEFLPWFRRETAGATRAQPLPVSIDMHVFADGGLFIDNNLARAELRGDLRVRGEGETVTWSGRIDVLNGDLLFRRRRFSINSGTVQFAADRPLDPDLDLEAETQIISREEDYHIQLRVSGSAERPRIQFTADDPALSENDVLALATFGRTVSQLQSQGAGFELSELGQFLSATAGARGAGVEERLQGLLPVDRIEIEPSYSRSSGTSEPRLSVAKDLTERFSALIGTSLGSERRQDAGIEYRLTPRISVAGVWESQTKSEAGAFGGEVKFRVPFRRLRPFSLLSSLVAEAGAP